MITAIQSGRDAVGRHAWAEAMESLPLRDKAAAYLPRTSNARDRRVVGRTSRPAVEALERAFASYEEADPPRTRASRPTSRTWHSDVWPVRWAEAG